MKTLYKRANVLSMKTDEISYFSDVLVENGKISIVDKNLPVDSDTTSMDCTGKFIMPALFDAHAHLNSSEMGELFIANGITSIRNMSGEKCHVDFDRDVRAGKCIGPYIYSTGPIIDGVDALDKTSQRKYISSLEEAESVVHEAIEGGFQWVKTYPSIAPDVLKHLMDTANACGIKVCGHMSYVVDAKTLRDWGYHCCEHSSSLPKHDADIEYLAKSGMWFCPTQVVCETLPDYVWNGKQLTDLEHYDYVPQPVRDYWEEQNQKIIAGYKKRDMRPDINVVIHRGVKFMEFSDCYMAGSDTMYPGMIAGFSLHNEIHRLVTHYHRSNFEALKAATVNTAEYIGLDEQKGMIRKGFDADLLILDKNPLADVRNTAAIHAVVQGGTHYDRQALDAMLDHVRNFSDEEFEFLAPLL